MISPRSGHGQLTVPIAVVMCGTQVELICDGQMNPWLTIFGWTEDAGKAKYAALEKQERGHSKLHKDNDTIICNVRPVVGQQWQTIYTHTDICGSKYGNKGGNEKVISVAIYFAHLVQNANRA